MAKKQIVTNVEIEKDIVDAIKNPPEESERSYKSFTVPAIIIAVIMVVIEFIYPAFMVLLLLALMAFLICSAIFSHFRLKNKIKNVTINDYIITTEIVHSTDEEHYKAETGGYFGPPQKILYIPAKICYNNPGKAVRLWSENNL